MPNTFLTAQLIAREALPLLQSNMVMPYLVHRNHENEFKKQGDTIQIRKPAVFVADEFGGTINLQDVGEGQVLVKLDKIADVSVELTSKELTLNVEDFNQQILGPAVLAIAEKANRDLLSLYSDIPYHVGTPGSVPNTLQSFADARKVLDTHKVPLATRRAVWNPDANAQLAIIPAVVNAEKSGTTVALREGSMGRVQGLDNFMAQSVFTHVAGGYTALADVTVTAAKGATTIKMESAGNSSTASLKKGDIFVIGGNQYVVTADTAAAVAGDIATVNIYPELKVAANNAAVTFTDRTSGAHAANLAFHESAFCLVTRPLELPKGATEAYVTSFNGLSLRVVFGYNVTTKKQIMSIDMLYGIKTMYPELAVQVLG
ncbi:P22 phage major capsid protein family protein [Paenibacillus graminis]|uniref:P22 phage major capsid protein family protein n=1 Tax=Paenibacillus graminis TaxID=189425 RepID=UPI002DBC7C1F|nr:P22 phage major capsid protein family protein [Paenibacillus graminis]MEC0171661.1 P22 phage major capsid protein family protein [Paenibacillus graminis]